MGKRSWFALAGAVVWFVWGFCLLGFAISWLWATGLSGFLALTGLVVVSVVWENSG